MPTPLPGDGAREREVLVDDGPPRRGYGRDRLLLLDASTAADTLRPPGRLRHPRPVGGAVTALGDGTWLAHDAGRPHRRRPG